MVLAAASQHDLRRVLTVLVVVLICGLVLARSMPKPSPRLIVRWAARHRVELTPSNRPLVVGYLQRMRRARGLGAAGLVLGGLVFPFVRPMPLVVQATVGFLLGALVAEMTMQLRQPSAARSALLAPRVAADYQARWLRWALVIATAAVVGLAGWLAAFREGDVVFRAADCGGGGGASTTYFPVHVGTLILSALLCVVTTLAARAVARVAVSRAQPVDAEDLLAADDAIRAASSSTAAAAALGIALVSFSALLQQVRLRVDRPCNHTWQFRLVAVLGYGCGVGALLAWIWVARYSASRRTRPTVPAGTA